MSTDDEATKAAAAAIANLASDVYDDVARPAAKQVGTALETIFKVGLTPVKLLDWGYEQSKEWLAAKIKDRMSAVPAEFRQAPPHAIVIGTISNIAMNCDAPGLRDWVCRASSLRRWTLGQQPECIQRTCPCYQS